MDANDPTAPCLSGISHSEWNKKKNQEIHTLAVQTRNAIPNSGWEGTKGNMTHSMGNYGEIGTPSSLLVSWNSTMIANSMLMKDVQQGEERKEEGKEEWLPGQVKSWTALQINVNATPSVGMQKQSLHSPVSPKFAAFAQNSLIADGRILLDQKIGSGAFGEVFVGTIIATNELVAVKKEAKSTRFPQLLHEFKMYSLLRKKRIFLFGWLQLN